MYLWQGFQNFYWKLVHFSRMDDWNFIVAQFKFRTEVVVFCYLCYYLNFILFKLIVLLFDGLNFISLSMLPFQYYLLLNFSIYSMVIVRQGEQHSFDLKYPIISNLPISIYTYSIWQLFIFILTDFCRCERSSSSFWYGVFSQIFYLSVLNLHQLSLWNFTVIPWKSAFFCLQVVGCRFAETYGYFHIQEKVL